MRVNFKTLIFYIFLSGILSAPDLTAGGLLTQYGSLSLNLSGEWNFTPSGHPSRRISVPGFYAWKSRASDRFILQADPLERWLLIEGSAEAVYEKTFDIPASMAGKNIFLRFNAVNFVCDVYLNDTFLGRHKGGYVPFEFNISHIIQIPSQNNTVRVEIKYWTNDFLLDISNEQLAAWPTGFFGFYWDLGITDSVYVIARPDIYIDDIYVQTSVRENRLKSGITLINLSGENKTVNLAAHIAPDMIHISPQSVQINAGDTVTAELETPWTGRYWSPDNPELHDLVCHLSENGQPVHSLSQRFGFREFRIQDDDFMLNEIPFALRGDNIVLHGEKRYWPYLVPDRENWAQIVDSLLALNFNVIRLHHNPPPSWMIEICDEKGMLVIGESAIYIIGAVPHNNLTYVQNSAEWQKKWIRRDRNHPSIIMWSAENEMGRELHHFNPQYLEQWGNAVLDVDNTRPVIFEGDWDNYGRAEVYSRHYIYGFPNGWPEGSIYDINRYKHETKPSSHGEFEWNRGYIPGGEWARRQLIKTRIMRIGGWADIRPYRLDWAWHPHPEFFADNYLSPKPDQKRIAFLKQSFSPVAVFDKHYFEFQRFPVPPEFNEADMIERTVYVLNDEMHGTEIKLRWDIVLDGEIVSFTERNIDVPLGGISEEMIEFMSPIVYSDSDFELGVSAWKNGVQKYQESYGFRSINTGINPYAEPQAVNDLSISKASEGISLTWSPVTRDIYSEPQNINKYLIYHCTDIVFDPSNTDSVFIFDQTQWTDPHPGRIGDISENHFYKIRAVSQSGIRSASSDIAGAFDYQLHTTDGTNYNLIGLPLYQEHWNTAEDLGKDIAGCSSISQWIPSEQGFLQYIPALPFTTFSLQYGQPYLVSCNKELIWTLTGKVVDFSFSLQTTGSTSYNIITLPLNLAHINTASILQSDIPDCNGIARWNALEQGYDQYIPEIPETNFTVRPGYPYWVHITANSVWPAVQPAKALSKVITKNLSSMKKTPHAVWGKWETIIQNESKPVRFRAYLSYNPNDVLTEQSAGSAIGKYFWIVQCAEFKPGWNAGDTLSIFLEDHENRIIAERSIILTNSPVDQAETILFSCSNGHSDNRLFLYPNYPNPFNSETVFSFSNPEDQLIQINIYNSRGQFIKSLTNQFYSRGGFNIKWKGENAAGETIPSGIYIIVLQSKLNRSVQKALLIH